MSGASDYIINDTDKSAVNVKSKPTTLRGSATDNKNAFDTYPDMIASHFNDLCGYIDASISIAIERSVLELYASLGWVQS